jgi:hypothetical protein
VREINENYSPKFNIGVLAKKCIVVGHAAMIAAGEKVYIE